MKFRSDFVTNSSSANYTLVLRLQDEDELEAGAGFSVSPECAITMDGGMNGEDIGLDVPLETLFSALKECADINAVIDLLCNHIEIEMWEDEEDWDDEDEWEGGEEDEEEDEDAKAELAKAVENIDGDASRFPRTISMLRQAAQTLGIDKDNLRYVVAENAKYGSGDSAMWVDLDPLNPFADRYKAAKSDEERDAILEEAADYVLSEPEWPVNDNEYLIEGSLPIIWEGSRNSLIKSIKNYFEGKHNHRNGSYWMGSHSTIQKLDLKEGTITHREVFYVDD